MILLIHKIKLYGIRGQTNKWISDFLDQRKQAVRVDGFMSDTIPVKSGVPQGSVLGPCLFLAYINDLPGCVTSNTCLFADDTAMDRPIRSMADAESLQRDLDSLAEWETKWDMSFHPDKCNVLHVSRSRSKIQTDYILHGQKLESVSSTKYLGVTIQDDGEWGQHIQHTINSGNRLLGFLRRNLKINSKKTKHLAYLTLLRPKLEYAATVWDPHSKEAINGIEMIQRRAARFVLNRHRNTSSVGQMLEDLDWDTLQHRRKVARLVMLYKILNKEVCVQSSCLVNAVNRSRRSNVCHERQLQRLTCKKNLRMQSFFPRTVREWNGLTHEAVAATSIDTFRREVSIAP